MEPIHREFRSLGSALDVGKTTGADGGAQRRALLLSWSWVFLKIARDVKCLGRVVPQQEGRRDQHHAQQLT